MYWDSFRFVAARPGCEVHDCAPSPNSIRTYISAAPLRARREGSASRCVRLGIDKTACERGKAVFCPARSHQIKSARKERVVARFLLRLDRWKTVQDRHIYLHTFTSRLI